MCSFSTCHNRHTCHTFFFIPDYWPDGGEFEPQTCWRTIITPYSWLLTAQVRAWIWTCLKCWIYSVFALINWIQGFVLIWDSVHMESIPIVLYSARVSASLSMLFPSFFSVSVFLFRSVWAGEQLLQRVLELRRPPAKAAPARTCLHNVLQSPTTGQLY